MTEHALLSASGAHRWMVCTRAPRLEESVEEDPSVYAAEGTLAHGLAEIKIALELGMLTKRSFNQQVKQIRQDALYTQEMDKATDLHRDLVVERYNAAKAETKDAAIYLEQKLDYSPWVPQGFGTADTTLLGERTMEIIDLKYGMGIAISACENTQMKLYGLGAINQFGVLYDLDTVILTISQPRLDSVSSYEMTVDELLQWGDTVVKPKAELAFRGEGDFLPGEHCRFCKVKATCRARAEENTQLVALDFKDPPLLTDEEVVKVLSTIDQLVTWANDVRDYALQRAVNEDKQWPGMKLVEGRGSRKYTDEGAVTAALQAAGIDDGVIFKRSLNPITNLERALGKKEFQAIVGPLVQKAPGKPKLVVEGDSRPAIEGTAADFD